MGVNMLPNVKVTRVMNAVAAGSDNQDSSILDMQGYDGVVFVAAFGTITSGAVTALVAQQNSASATEGMTSLEGASVSVADDDDNKIAIVDVHRPRKRYVRAVVERGTQNAVIDGVIAIQYRGSKMPIANALAALATSPVEVS